MVCQESMQTLQEFEYQVASNVTGSVTALEQRSEHRTSQRRQLEKSYSQVAVFSQGGCKNAPRKFDK